MTLSPEQFASLRRVLTEPSAKAAALVGLPVSTVEFLLTTLDNVARSNVASFGNETILIRHVPGESGGTAFDGHKIRELVKANTRIAAIGDDATFLTAMPGNTSIAAALTDSKSGACISVLCSARQFFVFANGEIVAEIVANPPEIPAGLDRFSWRELGKSIDLHFEKCVEGEKSFRYWADRKGRLLLAGPDGTEKLFHISLFWWCKHIVADVLDVYGEAQGMGQDKTDITIVTEPGNIVIEVKWLGVNEHGTPYAQLRIDEGLIQVAEYLERDSKLMKGYLVMYDARSESEHKNESGYPPQSRHSRCDEPILYFLRSETPSEVGVRVAKKNKPKAKPKPKPKAKTK